MLYLIIDSDEPKGGEKRQKGGGILAPLRLSDALVEFLGTGESELPRSNVIKRIWDYIKQNNLQVYLAIMNPIFLENSINYLKINIARLTLGTKPFFSLVGLHVSWTHSPPNPKFPVFALLNNLSINEKDTFTPHYLIATFVWTLKHESCLYSVKYIRQFLFSNCTHGVFLFTFSI